MKYMLLCLVLAVGLFMAGRSLQALETLVNGPVVVELFTSQSCSSCPPADALLGEISQKPGVIALGFHVTYWDHLHWKDTLSKDFSTDRQRQYSWARGSSRVYTPQMIVNGQAEFVGSNRGALNAALRKAKPVLPIEAKRSGDTITLSLPEAPKGTYALRLFATADKITQPIKSGENGGRTVTYTHPVMAEKNLGAWDGHAGTKIVSFTPETPATRIVILAQTNEYGPIAGAVSMELK